MGTQSLDGPGDTHQKAEALFAHASRKVGTIAAMRGPITIPRFGPCGADGADLDICSNHRSAFCVVSRSAWIANPAERMVSSVASRVRRKLVAGVSLHGRGKTAAERYYYAQGGKLTYLNQYYDTYRITFTNP